MDYNEFILEFNNWRKKNTYPRRDECREMFRKYRDAKNGPNTFKLNMVFEYILKQEKPSMFLDSLFKKNNSICNSDPKPEKQDVSDDNIKLEIMNVFYNYINKHNIIPKFSIINSLLGFKANKYFDTEKDLYLACKTLYDFDNYVFNEEDLGQEYCKETARTIKRYKKFLITTAVSGKKVNQQLLSSMLNYADSNDALILVLPSEDVANRKSVYNWQLDPVLKGDKIRVVHNDTYLNSNIYISDIKVSAKQINPQCGLPQFTQDGSIILGSPKQDLDYIANSPNKLPHAIMTTGAITEPDYSGDAFMSKRINKIAEFEHVMGCIVIEIEDDKIFHFRQMQMGSKGEIIDLGIMYTPNGETLSLNNSAMVIGDSHFGEHDENIVFLEKLMISPLGVRDIVMHDVFSAQSITHHDKGRTLTLAKKAIENKISLEEEANMVAENLEDFSQYVSGKIYIANSNHHEHLYKYLDEGRYATDKVNLRYSLDLVKAVLDGEEIPLKFMIENQTSLSSSSDIYWIGPDEDLDIYGVEVSQHGHNGANGGKGNLLAYRRAYKKSMSAHTHTPKIKKGACSVGTSTLLRLSYCKGLSSWVHCCGIIYENGTYQLINIIKNKNGKYSWRA